MRVRAECNPEVCDPRDDGELQDTPRDKSMGTGALSAGGDRRVPCRQPWLPQRPSADLPRFSQGNIQHCGLTPPSGCSSGAWVNTRRA
jgi:hypothetical protein